MTAELERLATLRNQRVLTNEELAAAKAKLLGLGEAHAAWWAAPPTK